MKSGICCGRRREGCGGFNKWHCAGGLGACAGDGARQDGGIGLPFGGGQGLGEGAALTAGFVEKDGASAGGIEGVHLDEHGDGDAFVADLEDGFGNAVAFAAEDDAAVAGEVGLHDRFATGFGVGGKDAKSARAQVAQSRGERSALEGGQVEDDAHRTADAAAEVGAAGGFADEQGLRTKRAATADEGAEIFGVAEAIDGGEQVGAGTAGEDGVEAGLRGNLGEGKGALMHRVAGDGFEEFFRAKEHADLLGAGGDEGGKALEPFLGEQHGMDGVCGVEEAGDDLDVGGDENAAALVILGALEGAVGFEVGEIERFDFLGVKHVGGSLQMRTDSPMGSYGSAFVAAGSVGRKNGAHWRRSGWLSACTRWPGG